MIITKLDGGRVAINLAEDELDSFGQYMNRALNCNEPQKWPAWARMLDSFLEQRRRDAIMAAVPVQEEPRTSGYVRTLSKEELQVMMNQEKQNG